MLIFSLFLHFYSLLVSPFSNIFTILFWLSDVASNNNNSTNNGAQTHLYSYTPASMLHGF